MKKEFLKMRTLPVQIILVLAISMLTLLPVGVLPGHASSTLVCLSNTTDSCPASPDVFTGPVGSIVRVNVVISNTAAFNGFEVWLATSSSVLNTTSIDLMGSILPGPTIGFECNNGQGCQGWLGSGPGTDALYASGNTFTSSGVTGLLFSVNYRVVGTGNGVPLGLYFQVSPSGWETNAAGINYPSGTALVPVQDATFNSCTGCPGSGNVNISQTATFRDVSVAITGSLDLNATTRTLTGTITLQATNVTTGAVIFSKTFSINFYFGVTTVVRFVMVIPSTPTSLGTICSINTITSQAMCMVARNPDPANNGWVSIIDAGMLAVRFGSSQGSPTYSPLVDLDGNGTIDIIDAGIMGVSFGAPVFA